MTESPDLFASTGPSAPPEPTERPSVMERPMYICWVLLFLAALSVFEIAVPIGIYVAIYGVPTFTDLLTNRLAEYSHSTLWNERVWYSVLKAGPGNLTGKGTLASFDPEKGDVRESQFQVPFPLIGIVPDGDRMWAVSSMSVTKIEEDRVTEFKPIRSLGRTSEPFLYEDRLAIIDIASGRQPTLLVFDGAEWTDAGRIVVPFGLGSASVDGKTSLVAAAPNPKVGASLMDLTVVASGGKYHLFMSDGSTIAYKRGFEIAPTSALAPENSSNPVDLCNLDEWEFVCTSASGLGRAGIGRLGSVVCKVGLVNGEPVVITVASSSPNPFQGNSLTAHRRIDGDWQQFAELPTQSLMSLLVVTDGQNTYVSGQSIVQVLRVHRVTQTGMLPNGIVIKAPVAPLQAPMERFVRIGHCVYWPSLLVLVLVMSRLTSAYRSSLYQFGMTNVELASFTRRGIARIIDTALFWIPAYGLIVASGMSSQEQIAENLDKIFDFGKDGLIVRAAWLYLYLTLLAVSFLIVNSVLQGVWGVTLGKWICGIRTVRSTLRPCGFFRALFRDLLLLADTFFAYSFIPVTLAIAFSANRQRLGDMAADTIVIRKPKQSGC